MIAPTKTRLWVEIRRVSMQMYRLYQKSAVDQKWWLGAYFALLARKLRTQWACRPFRSTKILSSTSFKRRCRLSTVSRSRP